MRASNWRRWLAPVLAGGAIACVGNPAPRAWLAPALQQQADPYGAWIVVSKHANGGEVSGEFLAVERDSVFVLLPDSVVRTMPLDSVRRAQVAFYDAETSQLAMWTILGTVSTISNGVILVLTAPMWVIGGSIATSVQSRDEVRQVDKAAAWDAVRMYTRFPGGLPENLPRMLPPKARR